MINQEKNVQENQIEKFNQLLNTYKPKKIAGFDFHRQKQLTSLIVELEQQKEKALKEMDKALIPMKKEVMGLHRQYEREAQKMGIINKEPRKEKKNDSGYRFAYYQQYLKQLLPFGDNKRFTLDEFNKAVRDGQKKEQHQNRLMNMSADGVLRQLNDEGTLFCTLLSNPEKGTAINRDWEPSELQKGITNG